MNVLDTIINFSESFRDKTIFDVLDDCIESARNFEKATINANWFIELKWNIEEELKLYANEHYLSSKGLMNHNCVIKTDSGLKVTNQTKDLTYLEIYFPSEFNPDSVIIKRCS